MLLVVRVDRGRTTAISGGGWLLEAGIVAAGSGGAGGGWN